MKYLYAPDRDFQDFASGRVIYARPGHPAFPVRLASEVFQRGLALWRKFGGKGRCTLYDPTCGGAYWLVALAYLHWDDIARIYASDIDNEGVSLAELNLSLLTQSGLDNRIREIKRLFDSFGKASHADALESAERFRLKLCGYMESHAIHTEITKADATDPQAFQQVLGTQNVGLILADVPYGWHTDWGGHKLDLEKKPIGQMLTAMSSLLKPTTIIAIATNKSQRVQHSEYQRLTHFQMGKRRIVFLKHY